MSGFNREIYKLSGYFEKADWERARKYERRVLRINLRQFDQDGTLGIDTAIDPSVERPVPKAEIVDGVLRITLKREIK